MRLTVRRIGSRYAGLGPSVSQPAPCYDGGPYILGSSSFHKVLKSEFMVDKRVTTCTNQGKCVGATQEVQQMNVQSRLSVEPLLHPHDLPREL